MFLMKIFPQLNKKKCPQTVIRSPERCVKLHSKNNFPKTLYVAQLLKLHRGFPCNPITHVTYIT